MSNQKSANRLLNPIEDTDIPVRDRMLDEKHRSWVDFDPYNYITKYALSGYNPMPQVLDVYIAQGSPDVYTLSAPELAIINSYGRYPNFVALMADTGTYVNDIQPTCLGIAGGFTSITVQLHGDGLGVNNDNTIIQFS